MAELVLGAAALYVGYKAAKRVRRAYTGAKSELYAEQDMYNYYPQSYPSGYHGSYYQPNIYGYRNGYSYGYR